MSGLQYVLKGTQQGIMETSAGPRKIRNVGQGATVEGDAGRKRNGRAPGSLVALVLPSVCPHGMETIRSSGSSYSLVAPSGELEEKCNPSQARYLWHG